MLYTAAEAEKKLCPLMRQQCVAFSCMAFLPGDDFTHDAIEVHSHLIDRWCSKNPLPQHPGEAASLDALADYERNLTDRARLAEEFTSALGEPPSRGSEWTWVKGYDQDEKVPFSRHLRKPTPRGRCWYFTASVPTSADPRKEQAQPKADSEPAG